MSVDIMQETRCYHKNRAVLATIATCYCLTHTSTGNLSRWIHIKRHQLASTIVKTGIKCCKYVMIHSPHRWSCRCNMLWYLSQTRLRWSSRGNMQWYLSHSRHRWSIRGDMLWYLSHSRHRWSIQGDMLWYMTHSWHRWSNRNITQMYKMIGINNRNRTVTIRNCTQL